MDFKIPDLKKTIGKALKPNYRDKLQENFSSVEKAQNLLKNLDRLRSEKSVDDAKYLSLKKEYTSMMSRSQGDVADLLKKINKELMEKRKELEENRERISDLEIRQKTGEITGDLFTAKSQELAFNADTIVQEIKELEILAQARSSADVGGFIDVSTEKKSFFM